MGQPPMQQQPQQQMQASPTQQMPQQGTQFQNNYGIPLFETNQTAFLRFV